MMDGRYIIYGLQDPRTDDIMYVGKSTQGLNRPKQHLDGSHNKLVRDWVNTLDSDNIEPNILVLEECNDASFLVDKEKFWIDKLLKEKHPLLNIIIYESHFDKRANLRYIEKELDDKQAELSEKQILLDQKIKKLLTDESDNITRDYKSLAGMIKRRRKYAGLTQKELADISGVGKTVVFDVERAKPTVQLDSLQKILGALEIQTVFMVRGYNYK